MELKDEILGAIKDHAEEAKKRAADLDARLNHLE
jgi:hypothetical protein